MRSSSSSAGVILALLGLIAISGVSCRAGGPQPQSYEAGQHPYFHQYFNKHHQQQQAVAVAASADEGAGIRQYAEGPVAENQGVAGPTFRQLAVFRVRTSYKVVSTTVTVTSKTPCASLVNVTGACRRRRRGVEDKPIVLSFDEEDEIDLYNPSAVHPIEPTPDPEMSLIRRRSADGFLLEGTQFEDPSSRKMVEVDISGLPSNCFAGVAPRIGFSSLFSLFGLTLGSVTTKTITDVVTTTITSGSAPFFISACTPNPFYYNLC